MRRAADRVPAVLVVAILAGLACRTAPPAAPSLGPLQLEEARAELVRPLPGDMAALYKLRVPKAGSLRLSVLSLDGAIRMSASEPFGSTLAIAASTPDGRHWLLDLREGCRLDGVEASSGLGLPGLPLDRAARLLAGRLPTVAGDAVEAGGNGSLVVSGDGWRARVGVVPDPWRVVTVDDARPAAGGFSWRVTVSGHTLSLPRELRVDRADGGWAELELVGLEWNTVDDLPGLPDLPPCRP